MQHLFFRKFYIFLQNWMEMTNCVHWLALSVLCFGSGEVPEWLQSKSVEPIWTALLNPKDLSSRISKDPNQQKQPFWILKIWIVDFDKIQNQIEQQNSSTQIIEIRKKVLNFKSFDFLRNNFWIRKCTLRRSLLKKGNQL